MQEIQLNGQTVKVIEQDFEIGREAWNEYKLLDGGAVRARLSVSRIFRLLNDDSTFAVDPQGDPVYVIMSRNEVVSRR